MLINSFKLSLQLITSAKRATILCSCLSITFIVVNAHAQPVVQNPQNMYNHVYWQRWGNLDQHWSAFGLDYIGKLNDTIQHAFTIGWGNESDLIMNRRPYDTATIYRFYGTDVIKARLNNDSFPDYIVYNGQSSEPIRVLFGTSRIDSFVTRYALYLHDPYFNFGSALYYVMDCDSDGYDDILFSNCYYGDSSSYYYGALFYLRGGPNMDTLPSQTLIGTTRNYAGLNQGFVGGALLKGKFRDTNTEYLAEMRHNVYSNPSNQTSWGDSVHVYLYPMGQHFRLIPTDSMLFVWDNSRYSLDGNVFSFFVCDLDGDGIDDICALANDKQRGTLYNNNGLVLGFRGGKSSIIEPTYFFHSPFANTAVFGQSIINLGDVCGKGYESILITDQKGDNESAESGSVYLYNIGKGYADSCIGYANGTDFLGHFGGHAIATGDLNYDSLNDFIVGSDEGGNDNNTGHLVVFLGDTSYATPITSSAVHEHQIVISPNLTCYPNPITNHTAFLRFDLPSREDSRIEISDMLGRVLRSENVPGGSGLWRVELLGLVSGVYACHIYSAGRGVECEIVVP